IMPRAESKQEGVPVTQGRVSRSDRVVTQVIRLEHADAQQLVGILSPLISANGQMVAYPPGNMLILTDSANNIARMHDILDMVDRANASSVKLYKLQFASADKMAQTLTSLYGGTGAGQAGKVKVLAHQPGNILIVVAPSELGAEIADVISRLDVKPEHETGSVQVRYLKNADAKDVAKVINQLVSGQGMGNPAQPGAHPLFEGDVKVVADPATNALLITADPTDMRAVNHIIDKLDIRRLQVLIEALIVEVSGNDAEQLGIEWMSGQSINNNRLTVAGAQNFGTIGSVAGAIQNNAGQASNAAAVAAALPTGVTVGVLRGSLLGGSVTMGALVHALQATTNADILSTPDILTMDNEPAEIIVGQNVPFVTGQNATQGGTAVPFQTIQRKDIGLTLKVTPQISEGNTVRLNIYQEVSSISNTTGAADIITNKRSLKTVALAQNQQMLVLGGLMREDTSNTVNRVPCIGAVPIVGEPFQYTANARTKTNLMIFLRPTIVRSDNDIQAITEEKYRDMKDLYEHPSPKGTILFPRREKRLPADMAPGVASPGGKAAMPAPAP
ncbi:MAG TPA: type II secretion system secretin GspD, partial [Mariprofundaceae bacterium]|nr:type II secretion system secretin GspD [Mariprofundaceae bacterium]